MPEYLSALHTVWSVYWSLFGVDFLNPYLWLSVILLEAIAIPLGAFVGYRWGILSPQAIAAYIACSTAGLYLNWMF
jgi:hypothetical protein